MKVQIFSSYLKGNAPPGYLIARIEIAPDVYAEAERNPYTKGVWTCLTFHYGDWDAPGNESLILCAVYLEEEENIGAVREIREILRQVSALFENDGGHPAEAA